jgi:hypothetical protein
MNAREPHTRPIISTALGFALLALAAATLAGCETTGGGAPVAQAAPTPAPPPMTHQQAAADCWMSTEKGHADMPLDKRADIVTDCINRKMGTTETAPETKSSKSDTKPAPKT